MDPGWFVILAGGPTGTGTQFATPLPIPNASYLYGAEFSTWTVFLHAAGLQQTQATDGVLLRLRR